MKLERIIDILGEVVGTRFIVKRQSLPHSTFKGYLIYTIEVFRLIDSKNFESVYRARYTISPKSNKDAEINKIEQEVLKVVLSGYYYGIKQVSDTTN